MNGWHRLFVLAVVTTGLGFGALHLVDRPNAEAYAAGCNLISWRIAPERAKEWLRAGAIPVSERRSYQTSDPLEDSVCRSEIEAIASGERYRQDSDRWLNYLRFKVIAFAVFWTIVYVVGRSLGWVWRGFFPKRQSAP